MMQQAMFDGFEAVDTRGKLEQKFIIPPFSILDTRQGYWQDRKRLWLSLGLQSEIGRGETLTYAAPQVTNEEATKILETENEISILGKNNVPSKVNGLTFKSTGYMAEIIAERGGGTSIFDPVLCELIYKWFCPGNGIIYDPFAGGSVRGIVANILGYNYHGIDLSSKQIEANREQAKQLIPDNQPIWYTGDSNKASELLPSDFKADFVFSCPPYHDLEKYTDDGDDISNMSWDTFKKVYASIIAKSVLLLNYNRFACFVVSEIRDEVGGYKGLVPYTIDCFKAGGMRYYNELILVNVAGSLPVRITHQFTSSRKIGRTHQNILVFYKGDLSLVDRYFKDIKVDIPMGKGNNNND